MKKLLILVWFLVLTTASAYATGSGLDAPHNETNTIGCYDCHGYPITLPTDDSICLQCHVNASGGGYSKNSAPKVATHSSDTTSTKYGTWAASCRDCHRVHTQTQRATYGPTTYLGTGTITSATNNANGTATFSYSGFTELRPGWSDFSKWGAKTGNQRGLIMYPNPNDLSINFEILSATANTITTKGATSVYPAGSIPQPLSPLPGSAERHTFRGRN